MRRSRSFLGIVLAAMFLLPGNLVAQSIDVGVDREGKSGMANRVYYWCKNSGLSRNMLTDKQQMFALFVVNQCLYRKE